jgi:hypothetical protein
VGVSGFRAAAEPHAGGLVGAAGGGGHADDAPCQPPKVAGSAGVETAAAEMEEPAIPPGEVGPPHPNPPPTPPRPPPSPTPPPPPPLPPPPPRLKPPNRPEPEMAAGWVNPGPGAEAGGAADGYGAGAGAEGCCCECRPGSGCVREMGREERGFSSKKGVRVSSHLSISSFMLN